MRTREFALGTAIAILMSVVSGCDSAPEDKPLDGIWTGSIEDAQGTLLLTFRLANAESVVTGTGSFTFGALSITGDVTGSYFHPQVRLSWSIVFPDETVTLSYVGQRSSTDRINGTITGVDGGPDPLVLTRTSEN